MGIEASLGIELTLGETLPALTIQSPPASKKYFTRDSVRQFQGGKAGNRYVYPSCSPFASLRGYHKRGTNMLLTMPVGRFLD